MNRPENLKDLFSQYNTLTGDTKVAKNQLENYDKKFLIKMFALTAVALAYRYVEEEKNPWDDRNKMSKKYSYDNLERFKVIYEEYAGSPLPETAPGGIYYSKALPPRVLTDEEYEWVNIINSEHPTLIQSYFRGMVRTFSEELGLPDSGFPYI